MDSYGGYGGYESGFGAATSGFGSSLKSATGGRFGTRAMIVTVLVILGMIALYFMSSFLFSGKDITKTVIVADQIKGSAPPEKVPNPPPMYEGGEYSVSMWVYIGSYNVNRNRRKHLLEIGGNAFKTLLIGLGAFKNTLVVRTHSKDPLATGNTVGSTDVSGGMTGASTSDSVGTMTPSALDAMRTDGTLTAKDVEMLFKPLVMDDVLLNSNAICDLPEIDMQRWSLVSVVLNGRTIDVYLDGKLARSCVTKSYYKVDPTGISIKLLQHGGFDGYLQNVTAYNYALNPDEVYRIYASGPAGTSANPIDWIAGLFKGAANAP